VEAVIVGDRERIEIPSLSTDRVGRARFRGLRLVHTHVNGELLTKEDMTDLAILQLDLIACVVERRGEPVDLIHMGYLIPENKAGRVWDFMGPVPIDELDVDLSAFNTELECEFLKTRGKHFVTKGEKDRALLVIVVLPKKGKNLEERQLELEDLCRSAGLSVIETVTQRPKELHPKYLIGKGKIEEVVIKSQQLGADLLVFDEELTPSQLRSISDLTELRVIDRNQLILDIFAARARTNEAKIQVELAQLRYILPRLSERTTALSRLTGGIGGRGPG
jgi:GTP-binding protein HflX